MTAPATEASRLLESVLQLRTHVVREAAEVTRAWGVNDCHAESAAESLANMAAYIALRQHDLRDLQQELVPFGLSSLGRLEGHVVETLDSVCRSLALIAGEDDRPDVPPYPKPAAFQRDEELLRERSVEMFAPPGHLTAAIMVTLEPASARSAEAVGELIAAGATAFRINLAHDSEAEWQTMIRNVRAAERQAGQRCTILADLGGPKIRILEARSLPEAGRVLTGAALLLVARDPAPTKHYPYQITASVAGLIEELETGIPVMIDDGHIETVVEARVPEGVILRVTRTRPKGEKLKRDKGLNAPAVPLGLDCLTPKDLADLGSIVDQVDNVGLSFVRGPEDIQRLQSELVARSARPHLPGIVAKIELQAAFQHLPEIIVAGSSGPFAVMIARGDLAVAVGFERLVEVQEEMLWLCQSARVPVIWATQVLEGLTKDGILSRAEVTDAAVSARAECVMLNKGLHIVEAVRALHDILARMSGHQRKKSAQLRALSAWSRASQADARI